MVWIIPNPTFHAILKKQKKTKALNVCHPKFLVAYFTQDYMNINVKFYFTLIMIRLLVLCNLLSIHLQILRLLWISFFFPNLVILYAKPLRKLSKLKGGEIWETVQIGGGLRKSKKSQVPEGTKD